MASMNPVDLFDHMWEANQEYGWCDALGGAEYRRVRREWDEAGRPGEADGNAYRIMAFIVFRANVPPRGRGNTGDTTMSELTVRYLELAEEALGTVADWAALAETARAIAYLDPSLGRADCLRVYVDLEEAE